MRVKLVVFLLRFYLIFLCNLPTRSDDAIISPTDTPSGQENITLNELQDLLRDVLTGYESSIRPRKFQGNAVNVNCSFIINTIFNFDITAQRIDVMGYFSVTWYDDLITWDEGTYKGFSLKLPLQKIWYPRITIGRAFDDSKYIGNEKMDRVIIDSSGRVSWVPDDIYSFVCEASVKFYPFDQHLCQMTFYVSDETVSTVYLEDPGSPEFHEFIDNTEWRLLEIYTSEMTWFSTRFITYNMKIERRADFTVYTMILPLVGLAGLNCFTFLIPIESGEKLSLTITIFLSYGFFVTLTRDMLPHNSIEVSYYIIYITTLLALSVVTVIFVIVESKIHFFCGSKPLNFCSRKSNVRGLPKKELANMLPKENKTWDELLHKIDTVVFFICFLGYVIFSAILWGLIMNREK